MGLAALQTDTSTATRPRCPAARLPMLDRRGRRRGQRHFCSPINPGSSRFIRSERRRARPPERPSPGSVRRLDAVRPRIVDFHAASNLSSAAHSARWRAGSQGLFFHVSWGRESAIPTPDRKDRHYFRSARHAPGAQSGFLVFSFCGLFFSLSASFPLSFPHFLPEQSPRSRCPIAATKE